MKPRNVAGVCCSRVHISLLQPVQPPICKLFQRGFGDQSGRIRKVHAMLTPSFPLPGMVVMFYRSVHSQQNLYKAGQKSSLKLFLKFPDERSKKTQLQQTVKQKGSQVKTGAQCTQQGSALEIAKSPPDLLPHFKYEQNRSSWAFPCSELAIFYITRNHINLRKHIQKDSCPCFQFGEEQRSFTLLP